MNSVICVVLVITSWTGLTLGCTYDGRLYFDGQRIPHAPTPCVTCYCKRNIVRCALKDCNFRHDCEPEYLPGQCCPRYDHCGRSQHAPIKNKFRSSSLQNNEENPADQMKNDLKEEVKNVGKDEDQTTEIVTVLRNDHRSKSALLGESANRLSLRRKKVFIGPNNKLLTESSRPEPIISTMVSPLPSSTTSTQKPLTTDPPSSLHEFIGLSSGFIKNKDQLLSMTTTQPTRLKDFIDVATSETRRPPYELDFEKFHQSPTTSLWTGTQASTASVRDASLNNTTKTTTTNPDFDTIAPMTTTTLKVLVKNASRSPKSSASFATTALPSTRNDIDEVETESLSPLDLGSPVSSREEPELTTIEPESEKFKPNDELLTLKPLIELINKNRTLTSTSGYARNIYKTTMSFFTGLFGRFG